MLIGAVLRLWQYCANSSLWIDELALARNIINRPAAALWAPLDYAQVAPVGFLLVEKGITRVFGTNEYALRAFPLACGLASLVLFWALAKRVLSGWAVPFGVGLFSLGIPFIYLSSQVKQYSSDVAVALLLTLAALEVHRRGVNARRGLVLGIAGAVAVWFSQTALFMMAGIGLGLVILSVGKRDPAVMRSLSITGALWTASSAAAAARSMLNVPGLDREYFHWFWADGFMPLPPHSVSDVFWLPAKLMWVFGRFERGLGRTDGGLSYRWSPVFAMVMAWGFLALWRKQRDAALFLMLPVLLVVCLSAATVYPFTARLIAFLLPGLLIATAAGASQLLTNWPRPVQWMTPIALAVLGGAPVFAAATALPPLLIQHVKPVFEHVSRQRDANDKIYVFYGASLAFRHYAPQFGLSSNSVMFGKCALGEPRAYLRELDEARGAKRVWLVATHVHRPAELELLLGYLDQIGHRLDAVIVPGSTGQAIEGAYGYLYDLSDQNRLASTTAETFAPALAPVVSAWRRWGCYGITGGEGSE